MGAPLSLNHQDGDSTQSWLRKKRLLGLPAQASASGDGPPHLQ